MEKKDIKVSIVIGTYNRFKYLKSAIESLRREVTDLDCEIIVVDGGSTDGSTDWLVKQKDIISIIQHNRGQWLGKDIKRKSWGYFMNLGFKAASGTYICMLSDDCLVIPGAIQNGIKLFDSKLKTGAKVGAVAFYWRNWPEQEEYWVGYTYGTRMFVNHGLYLRNALEKVNFVDSDSYAFYHADGDLGLRLWDVGYSCIASPKSYIEHYSDANSAVRATNQTGQRKDWHTFEKRWGKLGWPTNDGWEYVAYKDPYHTAKKYWSFAESKQIKRFKIRRRKRA